MMICNPFLFHFQPQFRRTEKRIKNKYKLPLGGGRGAPNKFSKPKSYFLLPSNSITSRSRFCHAGTRAGSFTFTQLRIMGWRRCLKVTLQVHVRQQISTVVYMCMIVLCWQIEVVLTLSLCF